ncbi:MAG: hypothetical protein AAB489_04430 [Patescibacteria group bacterium]
MKRATNSFAVHGIFSLLAAFALLLLFLAQSRSLLSSLSAQGSPTEIAVEHSVPLTLSLALAFGDGNGAIMEIRHDGMDAAHVSIPQEWILREVRGRALSDIIADPPAFGFTRWTIPADATVSYRMELVPSALTAVNPSPSALKIRLVKVDLTSDRVERDVLLVKDARVKVW